MIKSLFELNLNQERNEDILVFLKIRDRFKFNNYHIIKLSIHNTSKRY